MKFDVWSEGFVATGESGVARLQATGVEAPTFLEACRRAARRNHWGDLYREYKGLPLYWGCQLFDNEIDARKRYG